uniref:MH2 domain-containing protein n=1 Tax=Panagrellus redivivus TaxID=6233 RepID=A0A7E4UW63_PANRE
MSKLRQIDASGRAVRLLPNDSWATAVYSERGVSRCDQTFTVYTDKFHVGRVFEKGDAMRDLPNTRFCLTPLHSAPTNDPVVERSRRNTQSGFSLEIANGQEIYCLNHSFYPLCVESVTLDRSVNLLTPPPYVHRLHQKANRRVYNLREMVYLLITTNPRISNSCTKCVV